MAANPQNQMSLTTRYWFIKTSKPFVFYRVPPAGLADFPPAGCAFFWL
jgi:hypothetical protein